MTELLEKAVRTARALSPDMQDEIARMVLAYAGHDDTEIALTEDEQAAIAASKVAAARGDFATDEAVRAVWATYGL